MRLGYMVGLFLPLALATSASAAKVKVVWWDPYGPPFSNTAKAIIASFNKSHPNINVVREIGGGSDVQKLAIAMTSGKGPDCAHVWGSWNASQLWAMGLSRPLDAYMAGDKKLWDQVYPALMTSLKFRGKQLALPDTGQAHMLYWNKDMFSQAGLDPMHPPTFEELDLYAVKLTKKSSDGKLVTVGMNPTGPWGGVQAWIALFGGQLFDAAQEKVTANSEVNLKALRWVDGFVKARGGYGALSPAGSIEGGKVAMQLDPHYVMKFISATRKPINYMIGLPPAPGGLGGGRGPMVALNCNMVLRSSKHPAEAYEFLKFFVSNGGWMQPDTPDASPNRVLNEKFTPPVSVPEGAWKGVAIKVLDMAEPAVSMPGAERYIEDLALGFNAMVLGRKSPEQALQAAQIAGEKRFAEALKRARWGK